MPVISECTPPLIVSLLTTCQQRSVHSSFGSSSPHLTHQRAPVADGFQLITRTRSHRCLEFALLAVGHTFKRMQYELCNDSNVMSAH